jgi:hypothetical protein
MNTEAFLRQWPGLHADVTFYRPGWASTALAAVDLYPVIQSWGTAYDLGPHDEHIQTHKSLASVWHAGSPVVANSAAFWSFNGSSCTIPIRATRGVDGSGRSIESAAC